MHSDFLIIGGGIIGLTIARALKQNYPASSIVLIEKEPDVACHASGRNSGVLHAGFYYTADSLKAKFCRDGNRAMRAYCEENGLKVNPCQKLVVAADAHDVEELKELKRRGDANGVDVQLIDEQQAALIEPNAITYKYALLSPTTASVDPVQVCMRLRDELIAQGVQILMNTPYRSRLSGNRILAGDTVFEAGKIINCAGLYAGNIAGDYGFAAEYTMMPFKGVYLKYTDKAHPLRTLIYGVPDKKKPFLGVHTVLGVDGALKIGPTAIPALWQENYQGWSRFNPREMRNILWWQSKLFIHNAFGFRTFAFEEIKKYNKRVLVEHALKMVKGVDGSKFSQWSKPGIRAQLLHKKTLSLVQDFVIEGDHNSVHVLNAVSPAFTASMPFADWVIKNWVK